MRFGAIAIVAGVMALGLAWVTPSKAQGPLFDRVLVNIPYSVTVAKKTLQPGDYVIQEVRGEGANRRVLMIYSDHGKKYETATTTIAAYQIETPDDTKVVLHHYGPDYYFDKIWIQGKNYGYEFPLPASAKEREKERMQPIALAATYQVVQAPPQPQAEVTPPPPPEQPPAAPPEVAQAAPPPEVPPPPPPQMPRTSADWLMALLGGGALSGAGLVLRRKR